ncbi:MAG: type II toxin-antitoxin system VapC family toxin [Acidimicrobiaceae bacterium]|nr:type II toxin-antitoxin system VapC family toxin [Acidimicrobiaceae bacterium]MCO5331534.1 type II toxin-antitoxin system VapC family toxin [Ilumatobacteraceae bacterium]
MIVDANVLLYAVDGDSPFHLAASRWLEDALNGDVRVGLPWQTLGAFLRISTHPRIAASPLGGEEAWEYVEAWLAAPAAWVPAPGRETADVYGRLCRSVPITGNLVTDAMLAAMAIEHGVAIVSADADFARFPGVRWLNPLR